MLGAGGLVLALGGSLLSEQVTLDGGDCTAALVEGKGFVVHD